MRHGARRTSPARRSPTTSPHHEPVPVLRLDGATRTTCRRARRRRSARTRPGQPPVRPDRLRRARWRTATCRQVSFLKAAAYEDGHPGYSDPLDEQHFIVEHDQRDRALAGVGHRRRSSSPTTTPTAGTTTSCRRSCAPRRRRRSDFLSGAGRVRQRRRTRPRHDRPLRLRPAPAAAGRSRRRRRQNFVDHTLTDQTSILQLHRGQLAPRPHRRRLRRREGRLDSRTCSTSTPTAQRAPKVFLDPDRRVSCLRYGSTRGHAVRVSRPAWTSQTAARRQARGRVTVDRRVRRTGHGGRRRQQWVVAERAVEPLGKR